MAELLREQRLSESKTSDFVVIRGVRIDLDKVVNPSFFDPKRIVAARQAFQTAEVFPHIVFDDLFDDNLLDLMHEEFDLTGEHDFRLVKGEHEECYRSHPHPKLGSAAQLYFNYVNSGRFLEVLSEITSVLNLIPDPHFYGGGLHETRTGGRFELHVDFNLHLRTMLDNEMVLITYLNRDWAPEYGSALELWDADQRKCFAEILPEFGRTILFRHGLKSVHGHPQPLRAPDGRPRRSVASYYYTNRRAKHSSLKRYSSLFFPNGKIERLRMVNEFGRYILPVSVLRPLISASIVARRGGRGVKRLFGFLKALKL